jgi:UDP-galactopyranose mutase
VQSAYDLVCFSHLRWDFVYQRPQHLLSRFGRLGRVFFIEEPRPSADGRPRLELSKRGDGLTVCVPCLPEGITPAESDALQAVLLDDLLQRSAIRDYVLWYYTPLALAFSEHLSPLATIYDCMDELAAFLGAPPALLRWEAKLFKRADLVFTGGQSLYEAKARQHPSVHLFPSSVDASHFARARVRQPDPADQAAIPHPRLGFFGVLDERLDVDLLAGVADLRPDWHIVLIGPVVKISPDLLPRRPNIHYLGPRAYADLPSYLAGWDVATIPFARNAATRFISPTKTPEYLAAGRPVVSTSIRDVVRPYGEQHLAFIADQPLEFVQAVEAAMAEDASHRMAKVDTLLARTSWDSTWSTMRAMIEETVATRALLARSAQPRSTWAMAH